MERSASQTKLLHCLKTRGPQSVKILSNQLQMTTMGVRQHLAELLRTALVRQTRETRQNRGRPVHLWELTAAGHDTFPDTHARTLLELIDVLEDRDGADALQRVVAAREDRILAGYRARLEHVADDLPARIEALAGLRSEEGFMAEIRLTPDGWLLIENHCPIAAAARRCDHFCSAELATFRSLLEPLASVDRVDHLQAGNRRCAYRIRAVVES